MIADVMAGRTDGARIRLPAPLLERHLPLENPLPHQRARYFLGEFVLEPAGEPPHFNAADRILGRQAPLAGRVSDGLVQVFGDDLAARHRRTALFHQNRSRSGWIDVQNSHTPLPRPLLDET